MTPFRSHTSGYFIGLMSGTSADGIDGVLANISRNSFEIIATDSIAFDGGLAHEITQLFTPGTNEIDRLGSLDKKLATLYAKCVNNLLTKAQLPSSQITAIGNHGQTIRHRPCTPTPFTLQIGDASELAIRTNIPVVSDFRRADIALGGQGAPLTPGFHQAVFGSPTQNRCIVNIGGIANVTHLPVVGDITGWDTGPGNGLMDAWILQHLQQPYDNDGQWAASGKVNTALLTHLLAHPYFEKSPPKSTGKEEFTLEAITHYTKALAPKDVQATLLELSATTIAQGINTKSINSAYVCGGGAFNPQLMARLKAHCPSVSIHSTQVLGIAPSWVEAAAFAWLAHQFWHKLPGNVASVTGAARAGILGSLTLPA